MSRTRIHERIGRKYLRTILLTTIIFFLACLIWIVWIVATAFRTERTTILFSVRPIEIQSWDEKRKLLTIIAIPDDVRLEGVFGVGQLPVSSLVTLESMDDAKSGILARTLSYTLGTPVQEGSLSPALRLRYFLATRAIRPEAVKRIDLEPLGIYRQETLADQTPVRVFDISRYDSTLGGIFEIDSIRREQLRVRVVNTTAILGLGNRAARTISHAGMVVVAVESEQQVQHECTIHVKQDLRTSQSVRFIKDAFRCHVAQEDSEERADVTVRLGDVYATIFQ